MEENSREDFQRSKSDGTDDPVKPVPFVRKHSRHHSADLRNFFGNTPPASPNLQGTKASAFFGANPPLSPSTKALNSHSKFDRKGSSDLRVTFADDLNSVSDDPLSPPRRPRNRPLSEFINMQPTTPPPFLSRAKSDVFPRMPSANLETSELQTDPGTLPRAVSVSTIPHQKLTTKNEEWNTIQKAVLSLFKRRRLETKMLSIVLENIRSMMKSEVGPFLLEYCKNTLLKKGMIILREALKGMEGMDYLNGLGETWDYFFREILPMLQTMLQPLPTKELNVRQICLLVFRDVIVLKNTYIIEETVKTSKPPPPIRQMLLVIQSVHEYFPPSENQLKLEPLVALVVNPYLGYLGIYEGGAEPVRKALENNYRKKSSGSKPPNLFFKRQVSSFAKSEKEIRKLQLQVYQGHRGSVPNLVQLNDLEYRRNSDAV